MDNAAAALMGITKEEAKQLQAKYGLQARGTKAEQARGIAERASKAVTTREKYARQAKEAGIEPGHFFAAADEAHGHAKQWREEVRNMLKEARQLYQSENGKPLTNLHPAFRGGDSTQIKGFERIARTIAGRYPGMLGGEGDSTENAAKLYDYLYAGVPKYDRADAYEEALTLAPAKPEPVAQPEPATPADEGQPVVGKKKIPFELTMDDGSKKKTEGFPVELPGHPGVGFVLHPSPEMKGMWSVSTPSGHGWGTGGTKAEAVASAVKLAKRHPELLKSHLQDDEVPF